MPYWPPFASVLISTIPPDWLQATEAGFARPVAAAGVATARGVAAAVAVGVAEVVDCWVHPVEAMRSARTTISVIASAAGLNDAEDIIGKRVSPALL